MIIKDKAYVEVDANVYKLWVTAVNLGLLIEDLTDGSEGSYWKGKREEWFSFLRPLTEDFEKEMVDSLVVSEKINFTPNEHE